jgi:hypothetical protein
LFSDLKFVSPSSFFEYHVENEEAELGECDAVAD